MYLRLIVILASITWNIELALTADDDPIKYCHSEACNATANFITSNMLKGSDPCNNFYRFACDNFSANIPESLKHEEVVNVTLLSSNNFGNFVTSKLRERVNSQLAVDDEPPAFRKMHQFYKACVASSEDITPDNHRSLLREFGGWPVLDGPTWNDTDYALDSTLIKLRRVDLTIDYLIKVVTFPVDKGPMSLTIRKGSLGGIEAARSDAEFHAYEEKMYNFSVSLGADPEYADLECGLTVAFERQMAQHSQATTEEKPVEMSLEQLQSRYPFMNWTTYLREPLKPELTVDPGVKVMVEAPVYLDKLNELLKSTPSRLVVNYLLWRLLNEYDLSIFEAYSCDRIVRNKFRFASLALYARNASSEPAYYAVETLLVKLHETILNMIAEASWMDIRAKTTAEEKMYTMRAQLIDKDDLFDIYTLNEQYEALKVVEDNYFRSLLYFNAYVQRLELPNGIEPRKRFNWTESDGRFDAYFDYVTNFLNVEESFLNPLMFSDHRPQYLNYGFLGVALAHEMAETFYRDGMFIDTDGRTHSWYTYETAMEFDKRSQCLVNQFNKYKFYKTTQHVNGKLTLDQNMADNIGLKAAYKTYVSLLKVNGEEPSLPGLEMYNSKQMFWIAFANGYCDKVEKQYLYENGPTDTIAPSEHRVRGSVMNIPEFAQDFNCQEGAKMNPVDRCIIW